jgi:thymidylate synthase (FAD)
MEEARVLVLSHTPEPERICAAAARISTKEGAARAVYAETRRENIGGLIRNVMGLGHQSIAEHAVFNLAFENVSVFFEQYLIEFRLAAYTVKSRRYVNYAGMGWMRPLFRFEKKGADTKALETRYDTHMAALFSAYARLTELGIPKEDARFLLPCSFRSHIYCTMNARELLHFLRTSLHGRGRRYPEIAALGESLLAQVQEILPDVFGDLEKGGGAYSDKRAEIVAGLGLCGAENRGRDVLLLSATEKGEEKVAMAALMAEGLAPASALRLLSENPGLVGELLAAVLKDARPRELEQVNYTFHIPAISLAGLTHLTRHRIQSLCVPDLSRSVHQGGVLPKTVCSHPEALDIYGRAVAESALLRMDFEEAGLVAEDGVYLLLAGNTVDVFSTMNARQLFHFLKLRTCFRAQWEIRDIAWKMRSLLVAEAPGLFRASGPGCFVQGRCPEGKMSCGRMAEVKALAHP